MIKVFRYLVLAVFCLFFLLFTSQVLAAENWVIDNFQSQINIQSDGKVEVTETINADFGSLQKHGIFRDIPYIYPTQENIVYTDLQILGVLQDGSTAKYQSSKEGNFLRLKIGDPNRTISGKQEYQIRYLTTGVLRSFEDHDELYWDVTGNGWPVPITRAEALVTLSKDGLLKAACFQGVFGSKTPCNLKLSLPRQATFTTSRSLQASEGLTVVVGYEKGLVPIIQVTSSSTTYSNASGAEVYPPNMVAFFISLILGTGLVFWLWWKKGREQTKGHKAIMVEYFPPEKLRPAEIGVLLDERADTLDVSATIIDLATRGFLTIIEEPKKWLFGNVDYVLSRTGKDQSNMLPYEKGLLNRIFDKNDIVKISALEAEFYDDLATIKQMLYHNMVNKKFFPTNPEKVKGRYLGWGILVLALAFVSFIIGLFESSGYLGGVGLATVFTGIILIILSRSFAHRTNLGYELFRRVLGFKLFIEKAEKYKQQFLERENIFSEILPYAIVFGATEKFAKAFDDLGIKPAKPTWYTSSGSFNAVVFSSSINNFSGSLTSAIASQPTRNSFVSVGSGFSGGSSGGGFGGGGGGGW